MEILNLFSLLISYVSVGTSHNEDFLPTEKALSESYTYLMLTQDFPSTYCHVTQSCTEEVIQALEPNMFKIHGLWPMDDKGGPQFCDPGRPFNPKLLSSSTLDQMNTWWPSYKGNNTAFWEHEWDKHGTCLLLEEKSVEQDWFFNTVLGYNRDQYNITRWIDTAMDFNGEKEFEAPVVDLRSLIKTEIGVGVNLLCAKDPNEDNKVYLDQISICLTPDLELMDCPPLPIGGGDIGDYECGDNEVFHLPTLKQ
mmetsp:Transcript_31976/g.36366  ORF Transcript_31976/g.36366 Transcript_31976/m.36366 type:complete len:252 (+) Transcript_31976:28-783(+)